MDFELDLDKNIMQQVQRSLESAVDDSVRQSDIDYAGQQIMAIIMLRTRQGRFFTESGNQTEQRQYRSEQWKRKRMQRGLQTSRVDLFFGEGGLLEGMRVQGRSRRGDIEMEVGYLDGLSESRATEIARYMNRTGVGINRVMYRYIGLTRQEETRVITSLRKRITTNIQNSAG